MITRFLAGAAAGYLGVRAARSLTTRLLDQIDAGIIAALANLDDDDLDDLTPEPCVCGSTEHTSKLTAQVITNGHLDNGEFGTLPLTIAFQYDETDPVAVVMDATLHVEVDGQVIGHDSQAWAFARDILDTALSRSDNEPVGEGDVTVQYIVNADQVWIWLSHIDGTKRCIVVEAEPVRAFMAATFRIVPQGEEHAEVEAEIEHLFGGQA